MKKLRNIIEAYRRWMRRIVLHLHSCRWEATRWNGYWIEVEQRCKTCGAFRRSLWDDHKGDEINWRDGKHPNRDNWKETEWEREALP